MDRHFESRVRDRALKIHAMMGGERPHLFREGTWQGTVIRRCLDDAAFKTALFRFIDVLPSLDMNDDGTLISHLEEYFCGQEPPFMRSIDPDFRCEGASERERTARAREVVRRMDELGEIFVAGRETEDLASAQNRLRSEGCGCSADLLGEAVVSEREADEYTERYLHLLDILAEASEEWTALGSGASDLDWDHAPPVDISIKPTSLYSQMHGPGFDDMLHRAGDRLRVILRRSVQYGAHVTLDMEYHELKNLTMSLYRSLMEEEEFAGYPHTGIVIQSYLQGCGEDLEGLFSWAEAREQPLTVRLVKGAYFDAERVLSPLRNWPCPVFTNKYETDLSFEASASAILGHHDLVKLACATQNLRSLASVLERIDELGVPSTRYEFQIIYGMDDPLKQALLALDLPLRIYTPVGRRIPGMAYLIRRLLENTMDESFLAAVHARGRDLRELILDPGKLAGKSDTIEVRQRGLSITPARSPFSNEPLRDWSLAGSRRGMERALENVRKDFPCHIPIVVGEDRMHTGETFLSVNPDRPDEVVGTVARAGREQVELAVGTAAEAFPAWRKTGFEERAGYLFRAAEVARILRDELAALEVFETGKTWEEADGDVCEAIDYLEYYGRQMIRIGKPVPLMTVPGENNVLVHEPRGVAAVIAPWNFPLAISTGMTAAALVTGNTVVYKPSSQSAVTGFMLHTLFVESGLPPGVLSYLPGSGKEVGDGLVTHPAVSLIAFTGSREVGSRIIGLAGNIPENAGHIKHVVAEMGGKNAVIVDRDADVDEAVIHVLRSAFGYGGQKCSACSRLIVVGDLYDGLMKRLGEAAESLVVGSPERPGTFTGPLIERSACERVGRYIDIGTTEGEPLFLGRVPEGPGFHAPLAILTGISPESSLAREEIFGPVLSVFQARDFEEALDLALQGDYALTGAVFSRSPRHIEAARRRFRVGNLYINRGSTGALVGRHPFGGFKRSGLGSKAGGPDYLLQFMVPRTVSENTFRKGFAPQE